LAFCVTRTCDPQTTKCTFQGICNLSGEALFWPNSCVSFDVQQDGSLTRNIPYDAVHTIVVNAFAKWTGADCGGGAHPSIMVVDKGPVVCSKPEYNKTQPNANVIAFHDATPWPHPNALDTLALTTVYFNGDTGEIYDADIEVNSNIQLAGMRGISTADVVPGDSFDLQSILTHETGHFLGLAHSNAPCSSSDHDCPSMDAMYQAGSSDFRTLEKDDIEGICAVYPVDRASFDNECAPRHGFATDCGASGKRGCCSTAPGAASSRGSEGLFAALFGLGVLAMRVRRPAS